VNWQVRDFIQELHNIEEHCQIVSNLFVSYHVPLVSNCFYVYGSFSICASLDINTSRSYLYGFLKYPDPDEDEYQPLLGGDEPAGNLSKMSPKIPAVEGGAKHHPA